MKKKKSSTTKIVFPQLDKYLIIVAVLIGGYFVVTFAVQTIGDMNSQYVKNKQDRFEKSFIACYKQLPQYRSSEFNNIYNNLTESNLDRSNPFSGLIKYSVYNFDYNSVPEEFANCMKAY
ncbi:hypothetical protein KJ966_11685 [bacterium]|nr:hypothetical protein [bacterium]